jgi:hypothetical protein
MKISHSILRTYVPEGFKVQFGEAYRVVGRVYCGALTAKGLCTENCENCKARLQKAMQIEKAVKPAALFTWMLRNAVAAAQEENQAANAFVPDKNPLGFSTEAKNPFQALLDESRSAQR